MFNIFGPDPSILVEEFQPGDPGYNEAAALFHNSVFSLKPNTERAVFTPGEAIVHDLSRPVAALEKKDPWRQSFYK